MCERERDIERPSTPNPESQTRKHKPQTFNERERECVCVWKRETEKSTIHPKPQVLGNGMFVFCGIQGIIALLFTFKVSSEEGTP